MSPEQRRRRNEVLRNKRGESVLHDDTLELSTDDLALLDDILFEHKDVLRYLADR